MQWLKKEREAQGLTMDVLAKRMGKHSSFVAKTEGCERRLDVCEYATYCQKLGLDPRKGLHFFD